MTNNDRKRFAEIMVGLAENFGGQLSPQGIDMRFQAMIDYDIEDIAIATAALVRTRTRPGVPTIAEIIDAIPGRTKEPSVKDRAARQAAEVMRAVREVGYYGRPTFSDPVTAWLMQTRWNWRSVCAMTESEHKWWQKDFQEAYLSAAADPDIVGRRAITNGEAAGDLKTLRLIASRIGQSVPNAPVSSGLRIARTKAA